MQYPEILSIIDANIERLQQARALLATPPSKQAITDGAVRTQATLTQAVLASDEPKRQAAPRKGPRPADTNSTTASSTVKVDSPEVYTQPTVTPTFASQDTLVAAAPSVVTVIAAQRPSSSRHRKQLRPQPSALQGLAPATPVAVSAEQAQRLREQKQAAQKARETAHEGRQEPVLSAEYLAQQWLRKGQNASQR